MIEQSRVLLLFPKPSSSDRDKRPPGRSRIHVPTIERQIERIEPRFEKLQTAFDARRVTLQSETPTDDPDLVVVFETVGSIESFIGAVRKLPGLEWLHEADLNDIEPDRDFYNLGNDENETSNENRRGNDKPLSGRLYLLGTNRQALSEIVRLWGLYKGNPKTQLQRGLAKWKEVFKHLRDVRFWGVTDRLGTDIRSHLETCLMESSETIRFEIEAWCHSSTENNDRAAEELSALIQGIGGRVLSKALIESIAYHGFLVELPRGAVQSLLDESPPDLVLSNRVMFFRPRGQAFYAQQGEEIRAAQVDLPEQKSSGQPVIAMLDGLPMQNHPLLAGRISIDDPDGWESTYQAKDRLHGTAMASLILHGELDGPKTSLSKPIYARPIMRPDTNSPGPRNRESTPDDILLIDLVHCAVRRMFETTGQETAVAPSVKVINLSIGDSQKQFGSELSPWARLLDWLSSKYQVLFVVSAGNTAPDLVLPIAPGSLTNLPIDKQTQLAMAALVVSASSPRLIAPAESINAITVGSVHADASTFTQTPDRFDLFLPYGISPFSRLGPGFRRAVKPDILLPGGRVLYRESLTSTAPSAVLTLLDVAAAPGHLVAAPPKDGGQNTTYCRGTSNSAALATRGAALAHAAIEQLRQDRPESIPSRMDAVLLKALLVHGADQETLIEQIIQAQPNTSDWRQRQSLITRSVGYGLADIDRAITCTAQRATLIGTGELSDGKALEFRAPLPTCLNGKLVKRRLTITLAWLSPVDARHSKYRSARLWIKPPNQVLDVSRQNSDWQGVQRGTVQHEILKGDNALAFAEGTDLVFKVNCAKDASGFPSVLFALCVTLEVAEGLDFPIYQEVQDRIKPRVAVAS